MQIWECCLCAVACCGWLGSKPQLTVACCGWLGWKHQQTNCGMPRLESWRTQMGHQPGVVSGELGSLTAGSATLRTVCWLWSPSCRRCPHRERSQLTQKATASFWRCVEQPGIARPPASRAECLLPCSPVWDTGQTTVNGSEIRL